MVEDLISAHLELFAAGDRAELRGPAVLVEAASAQNIGFALHELATNASKHGALSTATGRVRVEWSYLDQKLIRLEWIETGGPLVSPPLRTGFGHRVVMELTPQGIPGSTSTLEFRSEGLYWRLDFPAVT